MKRDMDLVRKVLMAIEASDDGISELSKIEGDYTEDEVIYHLNLLHEHGLTDAYDMRNIRGEYWLPKGLTWEGHDFVDAIRDDTVFHKALTVAKERGGAITFEIIKSLAISIAKGHI